MTADRASIVLGVPPPRRVAWGVLVSRVICALFAVIGVLPLLLGAMLRFSPVRNLAIDFSKAKLAQQGIVATYDVRASLWPLGVELFDVRVPSVDGGAPALEARRAVVRPKFFPLLAGKFLVESVEVISPKVRLEFVEVSEPAVQGAPPKKHFRITNLNLDLPASSEEKKPSEPFHLPIALVSISDGQFDVTYDGARLRLAGIDADLTTEDNATRGSSFDVALRSSHVDVTRRGSRMTKGEGGTKSLQPFFDEDEFCSLDVRFRFDPPGKIQVRRAQLRGSVDTDANPGTPAGCDVPEDDPRKVELDIGHLRVTLPEGEEKLPKAHGHVAGRVPLTVLNRLPGMPDLAGWVKLDANLRYSPARRLPDGDGTLQVHGIRVEQFAFAEDISSKFSIHDDVVTSPETIVKIAEGEAHIENVRVEPFTEGIPLFANVHVKKSNFLALMRDLGVSKHPHVEWDLDDVVATNFKGTLAPLKLDGDLSASTTNFAVFDKAADDKSHVRITGLKSANFTAKVLVRDESLQFANIRLQGGTASAIDGAYVSIGFHNDLRVDFPQTRVELADLGGLAGLNLGGTAHVSGGVGGTFDDPRLETRASIDNFVLGDIPFGNVTEGKVSLRGKTLDLTGFKATKKTSTYEIPAARVDFGGQASMIFEGDVVSGNFGVRDFFNLWHLDTDPRFLGFDGHIETRSTIRVVLGGPEDHCGGGLIQVGGRVVVHDANLLGERFDEATFDLDFNWGDRQAGLDGADIRIRSFTLNKRKRAGQTVGTVLGSATIARGGALRANGVFDSLPLSKLDSLGAGQELLSGFASGFVTVSGTLSDYLVTGSVDLTPIRINGVRYGASTAKFAMTQTSEADPILSYTACKGPVRGAFNPATYAKNQAKVQGELIVNGSLLGGQIVLDEFTMTRKTQPAFHGKVGFRKFDLGALSRIISPPDDVEWDTEAKDLVAGDLDGDLDMKSLDLADLPSARMTFVPTSLLVRSSGQELSLGAKGRSIELQNNEVLVPPLVFEVGTASSLKSAFTVAGSVHDVMTKPTLAISAELAPLDLAMLPTLFPKITRSRGKLTASVRVTGPPTLPDVDGALQLRDGEFVVSGVPPLSEVNIDLAANDNELRVTRAKARFAGGEVSITGRMPLKGASSGNIEASLIGKDLRFEPVAGAKAALDCELALVGNFFDTSRVRRLPLLTGQVMLSSFDYTRPINIDIADNFAGSAKRTEVEAYDPLSDVLALDVTVRARAPLRVRNNLADFQLALGDGTLNVTGTNQRIGLRGELKALTGGHIRFLANEFDLRQATIRFEDPTKVAPIIDALAITEYRRYTSAANAGASSSTRAGGNWRISLHAYGPPESLKLEMSSEPMLSQEDISLLLTVGLTKAETDQLGSNALSVAALEFAGTASGADRVVKKVLPIDDFRFGSSYSPRTGRSEPTFTIGKRLTNDLQVGVTSGMSEERQLRTNIQWRLSQQTSVQGSYDNINTISSAGFGNIGLDFRWRLEFE